jgi:hypothetical protein
LSRLTTKGLNRPERSGASNQSVVEPARGVIPDGSLLPCLLLLVVVWAEQRYDALANPAWGTN